MLKGGGKRAILQWAAEGNIVPPEQRADPARRVPRELSAVALKALAREKGDRYPSAAAFRQDLERYLEDRSVSARADSFHEAAWKLVKRNRAVSAVTTAAVLLLTFVLVRGSWANDQARRETEKAYADYRQEQTEKEERTCRAVPAFVHAARQVAGEGDFEKALIQIDFALEYEPENPEAHLLKGQILVAQKDFAAGREQLGRYLRQRPRDTEARRLAELCQGKAEDSTVLFALAEVFQQQRAYALAARLLQDVHKRVEARKPLLELYHKQIEAAWPGLANQLPLEEDGTFRLDLNNRPQVVSLQPLRGMQLGRLILENCTAITDLSPLKGMPLTSVHLAARNIRDVSPLEGANLTDILLPQAVDRGMSVLRLMKNLRKINNTPAEDFWKQFDAGEYKDLKP